MTLCKQASHLVIQNPILPLHSVQKSGEFYILQSGTYKKQEIALNI